MLVEIRGYRNDRLHYQQDFPHGELFCGVQAYTGVDFESFYVVVV